MASNPADPARPTSQPEQDSSAPRAETVFSAPPPRPSAEAAAPKPAEPPKPAPEAAPAQPAAAPKPAETPKPAPAPAAAQPAATPTAAPKPAEAPTPASTAAPAPKPAEAPKPAPAAAPAAAPKPAEPPKPAPAPVAPQPAAAPKPAEAPKPAPAQPAPAPKPPAAPPQGRLVPADAATAAAAARAGGQPPAVAKPAAPPPALPPGANALPPPRRHAAAATPRRRHWMLIASFVLMVVLPSALWGLYLWTRAADQYTSTVGFSVRREEGGSSIDMFGGIFGGKASSTASDTDILYEFIRSPDLVSRADKVLNIRGKFSIAWPRDFVFAFDPSGTIEDLTDYWHRQVKVYYDDKSGIITVRSAAFSPSDAKAIADEIFSESEKVVNGLSEQARQDATRQSADELEKARGVLTEARQAMTSFRIRTRIVDPTVDLGAQMTVMTALQGQLAEARVALDTLRQNARSSDNRVVQAEKRIASLEAQIEAERSKFGGDSPEGENYALLMADYERLKVDLEFAEGAHRSARVAYESALATAQRQSRYLAAHVSPTEAQRSLEPARFWLLGMGIALVFVLWSLLTLIYYSVRDRR